MAFAQELSLLLGVFLVSATLFGLPSDESNFTVDEFGKRHYVLVPENNNTSFLEELIAKTPGRYSPELEIFDYDDLTIDSQSLLLLPFASLFFFELRRGNYKFPSRGTIVFAMILFSSTLLIFPIPYADAAPTADFKIQRGNEIMLSASLTHTITEGIDFDQCVGDCFIKVVSSRHSGMGSTTGGQQYFDDFELYISDSSGLNLSSGNIIFTRHGTATDDRFTWEIWEYIGDQNGSNEIKVLDIGVCSTGSASATCDGAVVAGGAADDNDVVVYVTAHANPDTTEFNGQMCWVTSEWVAASDIPRFTRAETGNSCDISYAVVEFTGSNWNVQRIEHTFTSTATQTDTISSVGDISRAFFHTQQRNDLGDLYDGLCESGSEVELTGPTTLTYQLPYSTANWGPNMIGVTWIISNTDTTLGEQMIVNHYNPTDQDDTTGTEEENWQPVTVALTYSTTESALSGLSSQSNGCGNAYPRGYLIAILTDSTTVDFYQSDAGQNQAYTFQVVELPRSEKNCRCSYRFGSNDNL